MDISKKYYSIGEVSKLKDITVKALRYYHEIGLLIPKHINEENGYRYYSTDQLIYLDIIMACRSMDVSIKELHKILTYKDVNYILKFLNEKHKQIETKINNLKGAQGIISNITKKIAEDQVAFKSIGFRIKYYPIRYTITYPVTNTNANDNDILLHYLNLEHHMKKKNINTTYESGEKYTICGSNIYIDNVFEVIENSDYIKNKKDKSINIIPSGYFLTFIFKEESEEEKFKELFKIIKIHNIKSEYLITINLYADIFNFNEYKAQGQLYLGKKLLNGDILAQYN